MEVRIYSSDKSSRSLFASLRQMVKELPAAHSLGWRFALRNIKAKYRQSLLGILWSFLPPIATSLLWIVLNTARVVEFGSTEVPYPVFVLTGSVFWSVFSISINTTMSMIQRNAGLLVKINFPREALLVEAIYEILFSILFSLLVIVAALFVFQINISWSSLLFIPSVFLMMLIGIALGLMILPVSVLYKDVQFALPFFMQMAMYLTPVIYPRQEHAGIARILNYNPFTPVVTNARSWLLGMQDLMPTWYILAIAGAVLVFFFLGIMIQRMVIEILIERMGS